MDFLRTDSWSTSEEGDLRGLVVANLSGGAGAFVGGYVATLLGWGTVNGFDLKSFDIAIMGSIILLAGCRLIEVEQ